MDSFNYLLVWILTVLCVMRISSLSAPNKRIFNGTRVSITDYPYTVPIQIYVSKDAQNVTAYNCVGSIINNRWVISAAHCYKRCRENTCYVELRTGTNFFIREGFPHICDLALMHNQYIRDARGSHNDIALLRGVRSFLIGSIAKSIPLAEKPPNTGTLAIALGWGNTTQCGDKPTEYLRSIEIEILDSVRCNKLVESLTNEIDEGMLCAGATPRRKGTSPGDSGGPLVLNGTLVGITSMGMDCNFSQIPQVFVNVSYYYDWIRENTRSNSTQQVDKPRNSTTQVDTIISWTQRVDTISNSTQQVDTLSNSTQQIVSVEQLPHCSKFKSN